MPDEKNVYALDEGKNSWLTMTKEQILSAITQAVNEGTIGDIDTGFVTKLKEMNESLSIQFWFGTSAEFNAIAEKSANTLYVLTDDDMPSMIEELSSNVDGIISGDISVPVASTVNGVNLYKDSNEGDEINTDIGIIGQAKTLFYNGLGVNIGIASASNMIDVFTHTESLIGSKLRVCVKLSNDNTNGTCIYRDFRIDANMARVSVYTIVDFDEDQLLIGNINFGVKDANTLAASAFFSKLDEAWSCQIESYGCKLIGVWQIID